MNLWVELVLVSYAHSIGSAGLFLVVGSHKAMSLDPSMYGIGSRGMPVGLLIALVYIAAGGPFTVGAMGELMLVQAAYETNVSNQAEQGYALHSVHGSRLRLTLDMHAHTVGCS